MLVDLKSAVTYNFSLFILCDFGLSETKADNCESENFGSVQHGGPRLHWEIHPLMANLDLGDQI